MKPLTTLLMACTVPVLMFQGLGAIATIGGLRGEVATPQTKIQSEAKASEWLPVPQWLAGTWRGKLQTYTTVRDLRTGERTVEEPIAQLNAQQRIIGMQQDERGQIWHYVNTRARKSQTDNYIDYKNVLRRIVIAETDGVIRIRTLATIRRICKATNQCIEAFEQEITSTYVLLKDGLIKVELVIKDFDATGNPISSATNVRVEKRVCPFARIDLKDNENLRIKFLRFVNDPEAYKYAGGE